MLCWKIGSLMNDLVLILIIDFATIVKYLLKLNQLRPKLGKHVVNRHRRENDTMKSICWKKVAKLGHDTLRKRTFFQEKIMKFK